MSVDQKKITRRQMFKMAGVAGLGLTLPVGVQTAMAGEDATPPEPRLPQVPRRVLGKTRQEIPILLLGGELDFNQQFDPRFAEALRFGVNYFDVADCYANGASETAVGGFLERSGQRKDLWITTKSCAHDPEGLERVLHVSLERLKTGHVDLLLLHGLKEEKFLNPDMARMADKLKAAGKIRFFGFACHADTAIQLLAKAATLSWIDALMLTYNVHEFDNQKLNESLDACHKANIGLIAAAKFSHEPAALKAIWKDERITAVVSHMDTFEKMKATIAAALA